MMKNAVLTNLLEALLGAFVTFTLASLMHSTFVINGLLDINAAVSVKQWLMMTLSDWWGLLPGYGGVILVMWVLVILIIRLIERFAKPVKRWQYLVLGMLAMWGLLSAMQPLLDVTLIAGARSTAGLIAQCLSGGVGALAAHAYRIAKR